MREISEGDALIRAYQVDLAHSVGPRGLEQRPQVQPIDRLIGTRLSCDPSVHSRLFSGRPRASRALAEAAEREARRSSASRTSPSSAPRSSAGSARSGKRADSSDQPQRCCVESDSDGRVAPLESNQRRDRASEPARPFPLGFPAPQPGYRQILAQATKRLRGCRAEAWSVPECSWTWHI